VARLLEGDGLAADPASIEAYRGFAHEGGELAFGGDYPQPLRSDELYDLRGNGAALLRMDPVLERGGQRRAVAFARIDPRALKGLEEVTPYVALQRERGIDPLGSRVATPAGAQGAPAAAAMQVAASSTAIPAAVGAPKAPVRASSYASSLPVASTLAAPGTQLRWSELARYRGHVLQVWTAHNPPRTMLLLDANAGELSVKATLGGGHANYRIGKSAFLRATLVQ
jgi:hypothetical protein